MDANRLIRMLSRMLFRTAMKTGIDYLSRRGKPAAEIAPEDRAQAKAARGMAQRAQKAARLGRRFFR